MENVKIYLDISAEGLDAIEQNSIAIGDVLSSEGIENEVKAVFVNYESQAGFRFKDPTTLIVASSAAIASIGFAISKIISEINNKKQVLVLESLEEIRDKDGKIIFDKDGNPILKVVKLIEIIDPVMKQATDYYIELFKIFRLKISSK